MNKHLKYLNYVIRHKYFVFLAGRKTGASPWRLLKHDWSKFLPCEWGPYVNYFYGEYTRSFGPDVRPNEEANKTDWEMRRKAAFDHAWLHHQRANDHHWQYWILHNDDGSTRHLAMPEPCWREMVADWMGAGRAITGRWEALEWYQNNREKIQLNAMTRLRVEKLLNEVA